MFLNTKTKLLNINVLFTENPSPDGRENPRLFLARFGMTAGNSS